MPNLEAQLPGMQWRPYLLSALLFALSYPSFPWVRLEVLAWFWMVPMLLALRSVESFWRFLLSAGVTMTAGWSLAQSWLVWGSAGGALALFLLVGLVTTVPFVGFFVVQKAYGRRWALLTFPMIWTAWDWFHHGLDGTIGWLGIGVTQHKLTWLIQFIDITGMWGVVFWLVLLNVLIVMAIENRGQGTGDRGQGINKQAAHSISSFFILHSSFSILHSSFSILHSSFSILHSSFSILNSSLLRRLALIAALMFVPPVLYSAFVFSQLDQSAGGQSIRVMAVQPNIDPWQKSSPEIRQKVVGSIVSLTNQELNARPEKPDLIVWPEVAIPLPLLQDELAREFVFRNVARWRVPVVTGTLEVRTFGPDEVRPPRLKNTKTNFETFNAAVLLTPITTESGQVSIHPSKPYRKRKLMPFAEQVPFSNRFPMLSKFAVDLNWNEEFGVGTRPTVFSFQPRQGRQVTVATPICYEHFYPSLMAEFVRNGAQVITLLSNDAWFSQSHGEYQIAAFTTLRAIETRRSIVRCTNTGLTCCIDPFGQMYGTIPWWQDDTALADVVLSNRMSLYVLYPDRFPQLCAWSAIFVLLAVVLKWLKPLVYQ